MIKNYITLMRVYQWVKNLILFAGIIFAKKVNEPQLLLNVLYGFLYFGDLAKEEEN